MSSAPAGDDGSAFLVMPATVSFSAETVKRPVDSKIYNALNFRLEIHFARARVCMCM